MIERVTQKIAQPDQHANRSLILVVANETDDAVQRVEEKVWMQLHAQRIQLRLCELRFESRRQKLALAIFAIVVERVTDSDHGAINQQVNDRTRNDPCHARKRSEAKTPLGLSPMSSNGRTGWLMPGVTWPLSGAC